MNNLLIDADVIRLRATTYIDASLSTILRERNIQGHYDLNLLPIDEWHAKSVLDIVRIVRIVPANDRDVFLIGLHTEDHLKSLAVTMLRRLYFSCESGSVIGGP